MNCQISLAERIKALQGEIEEDQALAKTDDDRRFLRAKMDELEELVTKAEEAASKPSQPKEVKMPKRPRKEPLRAVPLQSAPDEKIVAEPMPTPVQNEEFGLPDPYAGERYLNYKHPDTGRISGKGMTYEQAEDLHARKLLRYKRKKE